MTHDDRLPATLIRAGFTGSRDIDEVTVVKRLIDRIERLEVGLATARRDAWNECRAAARNLALLGPDDGNVPADRFARELADAIAALEPPGDK